ncbi:hypothetical protein K469DRAFT_791279 [Zopfia rhizophila CBS 207.26]|uniref:Cellulose-binding family II protein n=1 Tax=Zopfia rhizophila CBS 207.26 TaxID=1314779 RepID=A0A6A6DQ97_9PEZI|nr:hypothetical protein K469DRAFT_791279 [Zopfia rhizophila CBS 207.26]
MKSTIALSLLPFLHLAQGAAIPGPLQIRTCSFDEHHVLKASEPISKHDLNEKTWNPPANLVKPLKEVWDHEMATYSNALGFKNYGYDQVMAGKDKINYCVRWEGTQTVTAAQREKIDVLAGFEKFPYSTVEVNVVGWAVKNANILQGDTSNIQVYTTTDAGGIPQCDERCGRFFHQDGDYSKCPAGAARHYDQSLWLTPGFGGGAGGDWGQRVGQEYFMQNIDADNIHIVLHELGHTFALDDFYDWTPTGVTNFIMLAGSATQITEFDAWMARDWWRNLKSRYGL